jgi:hypothetical protein
MQTFLPLASYVETAGVLDRLRLGKQRLECRQILTAIVTPSLSGWRLHPIVDMWRGHPDSLAHYTNAIDDEWRRRGYSSTMEPMPIRYDAEPARPEWADDPSVLSMYRSLLLRKDPSWYLQWGWTDDPSAIFIYPSTGRPSKK